MIITGVSLIAIVLLWIVVALWSQIIAVKGWQVYSLLAWNGFYLRLGGLDFPLISQALPLRAYRLRPKSVWAKLAQ
jgi:hypothetical protein